MPVEGVRRPAWAEIDTSALRHNLTTLREFVAPAAVCAVVKANGYGHGAVVAARAFLDAGAAGLAVAIVDEGVELRAGGISEPILLLAETPADALDDAFDARLTVTVGSLDGAHAVVASAARAGGRHPVHIKVDTGMHRMGVSPHDIDAVVDVLSASPNVVIEGVYTHFPVADSIASEDQAYSLHQMAEFDTVIERVRQRGVTPALIHLANSAAALALPSARASMVRIGLAAYGLIARLVTAVVGALILLYLLRLVRKA